MQLLPSELYHHHNAPSIPRPQKLTQDLRAASAILHPDSTLHLQLKGHGLTNVATGFFSNRTSSPALRVQAFNNSNGKWKTVAKSEAIEFDLNPEWAVLKLRCASLCRCDMERPIRISVWDEGQQQQQQGQQPAVAMGHFETTVRELVQRHHQFVQHGIAFRYDVVQLQDDGAVANVGKISIVKAELEIASEQGVQNERRLPKQRSASHLLQQTMDLPHNSLLQTSSSHNPPKESRRHSLESRGAPQKEEPPAPRRFLRLKLRGRDLEELPGRRLIGGTDQAEACSRAVAIGTFDMGVPGHTPFRTVHTTRVVANTCNPEWPEIRLPLEEVCFQGDLDSPVLLSAMEEGITVMGWCQTTARELVKGAKKKGLLSMEIHDNRKRKFGRIEVISAEIETEESDDDGESTSSEEKEAPPVATGWLQRTLDLASSLANSATAPAAKNAEDQEPEKAGKKAYGEGVDNNKENKDSKPVAVATNNPPEIKKQEEEGSKIQSNIAQVSDDEEEDSDDESSEDEDDSSVDSSDSDGSFVTVADVVSLAEKSISSGEITPEQKQGLLELKLMLTPKAVKPSAASILAGMPGWSLDGDSVAGTPKTAKGQPQQRNVSDSDIMSVQESVYLDEASTAAEKKLPETEQDIADIKRLIQQEKENDEMNDDLVADMKEDDEILRRQELLSIQAKEEEALRKQEEQLQSKTKRKKAKKKVQKTLKSIHRILKDNLTSIPENEQSVNASTRDKAKKMKNAMYKGMDRLGRTKSRNKKESRGKNTASRMLDRDRTRGTDLIRGRSRSPSASRTLAAADTPSLAPVQSFDTTPIGAASPHMTRTQSENQLGRSQSPTKNRLTASVVTPPTQSQEAGRSKSPTTRRRTSLGVTPTDTLSGVSGFDAVRSRSRSPSWRVRNISGARGRSTSPSFRGSKQEESAAIDRLVEMGFDRDAALSAYLAANKNEMAAANTLMDANGFTERSAATGGALDRRRARSRSTDRNGHGLRRARSRSTERNGPLPRRPRSRSGERDGPVANRARSRSIERDGTTQRSHSKSVSRRNSLSGPGAGEKTMRGGRTYRSKSPTQHDSSTRAGLRDSETSSRRGNRSSATTPRSGEGRSTRRPNRARSSDDTARAGKASSSKSRSRRKPARTKSSDEPGRKKPISRTKSSDESRPMRRKKSSDRLRKSISFVEGNEASDGGDFAKQFAVGKKRDSTIDREHAVESFAAPSLHESFPAPRNKSPMTSNRSSLPGTMTQVDSSSSFLKDPESDGKKRSRRRRNSLSGKQKTDNNLSPNESAAVAEGNVLHDSYPKTKKRSPTRRHSLSDANADGFPGKQEKQNVEESIEMRQLGASENLFDPDWASFPPPFPPLPDQDTETTPDLPTEDKAQNPEQKGKKKIERRSSIGGVNKSIGKHFKKIKNKGGHSPLSYLVSKGLTDEQAQAVIEEADIARMEDLAIMDDDMISEVAKAAGLKIVPAKKLSNAIKSYSEKTESVSLPGKFDTSSMKKGFMKVAGGLGKGVELTAKGAYTAGAAAAGAMEGLGKKSSKNKVKPAALASSDGHVDTYHAPKLDIGL